MRADVVVIGAGPAGLAAAIAAKEAGACSVVVIDRDKAMGGILPQCIHNGFGLHVFGEELTGPEYADRYIDRAEACGVAFMMDTMALHISQDRVVTAVGNDTGVTNLEANAAVLAMGCRERSAGALMIPGDRPSGVLSAGTAQRFVNIEGYMPGRNVVILGSGDIGLIMARRMTLEGAKVSMVVEMMPYSGGLKRNIVQCLDDFGIPLLLSHTVTCIHGRNRLEGVTIAGVDSGGVPIKGSEQYVPCDTLLLSVGLIPENEISRGIGAEIDPATGGPIVDSDMQTTVPGVFACGNVVHVHDLVDFVSQEAERAGSAAALYRGNGSDISHYNNIAANGVRYVVPQRVNKDGKEKTLFFRTDNVYKNCRTAAVCGGRIIASKKRRICTPGEMEMLIIKDIDITGDIAVLEEDV